ncbi:hypothetical protein KY345_05030 [Candidatus Woesearchaeota archaeon]|nr:hypothetical protein [Candidatus Woesearchaeota archaeon]
MINATKFGKILRKKQKVFGIGLSKTGTTSLTDALKMLGYSAKHFPMGMFRYNNRKKGIVLNPLYVRKYSAFGHRQIALTDICVSRFYKELDKKFPNSKFILTMRDKESWLKSCEKHTWTGRDIEILIGRNNKITQLHLDIYGTLLFDREKYKAAYERHINEVREYFRGREDDLLRINIVNGEGWEKLCNFLDKPIPKIPFPKSDCSYTHIFRSGPIKSMLNLLRSMVSHYNPAQKLRRAKAEQ